MAPQPVKSDPDLERLLRWLLAGWCTLVVSASLYPFDWDLSRLIEELRHGLPKLRQWVDPSRRDLIVNLLLYVPLGFIGALLGTHRSWISRLFRPLLGAALLSFLIEVLQHALPPRDPSLADWLLNLASALTGILLAAIYQLLPMRPLSARLRRFHLGPGLGLLLALWLIAHLAPFVPRLRPGRISAAWETSLAMPITPGKMLGFFICYLILGSLMRTLMRRESYWPWFISLVVGSLAARLAFVGHHLTPDEVIGCLLALPFVIFARGLPGAEAQRFVFALACTGLLVSGLLPASATGAATDATTSWIPFMELAGIELNGGAGDPGSLPVLERLFLGIGIAWLAAGSGAGNTRRLAVPVGIVLGCEFLQQWIPGRIPDTSDIAALLIGAALVLRRNS